MAGQVSCPVVLFRQFVILPTVEEPDFPYFCSKKEIMKKVLLAMGSSLLLVFSIASCQENNGGQGTVLEEQGRYTVLSPEDFKSRLTTSNDFILVDVRTPKEFEEGHIEGALNIDFLNPAAFDEGAAQLDLDKTLMIYCRSGKRSQKASEKLKAMGFREIYDLEGGFRNWEQ